MDRIYEANISATAPAAGGVSGYPTDGDPTSGVMPTTPGARWFHQQTEEPRNLIIAAGLTPDATNLSQVAAAVQTLCAAAEAGAITAAAADATTKANAAHAAAVADVNAEFTGTHQNLTVASGFQDNPGGHTHQWVQQFVSAAATGQVAVTYSKPFTGTAPIPQVAIQDASMSGGSPNFLGHSIVSVSLTGCVIGYGPNGGGSRDVTFRVDAWGTTV